MKDEAEASHNHLGWINDSICINDNTYVISKISNVIAFETSEGLVLVDSGMASGSRFNPAPEMASELREFTEAPVHTAIFTHGHIDHVHGLKHFLTDDQAEPRVIAHEAIERHFDRYERTVGLNETISARQIGGTIEISEEIFDDGTPYRKPDIPPDTLFDNEVAIEVGDLTFLLYHARGETDHQCWVHCPERDVICSSDLITRHVPNAGNPQKPQRYPEAWAKALQEMAAKEPRHLCPGHGAAFIDSPDEIQSVLTETASYLESIVDQTLDRMNDGAPPHVDIVTEIEPPDSEADWLQESYDEAEFIARNVIRQYGGWWSGRPSELKPARRPEVAEELAELAGGVEAMTDSALRLLEDNQYRLATHLVDYALEAAPEQEMVQRAAATVYEARADTEGSLMATNIFLSAADYARNGRPFR